MTQNNTTLISKYGLAKEFVTSCEKTVSRIMGRNIKLVMNLEWQDAVLKPIRIEEVITLVAAELVIEVEEIKRKSRKNNLIEARSIIARICKDNIQCTLLDIADALGGFDHTSIINSLNNSHDWEQVDRKYRNDLRRCQEAYNYSLTNKKTIPC